MEKSKYHSTKIVLAMLVNCRMEVGGGVLEVAMPAVLEKHSVPAG